MTGFVSLGYGRAPLRTAIPKSAFCANFATNQKAPCIETLLEQALLAPVDAVPLAASSYDNVVLVISDATRADPRTAMVAAVLRHLKGSPQITFVVANGTHAPGSDELLDWSRVPHYPMVQHDCDAPEQHVELGVTERGTPLVVNRALCQADLVVALGVVRPHYFAGYGGGVKALFPGLGARSAIRQNHQLKSATGAATGQVDGNPCREDLEELLERLPCSTFLVNTVVDRAGEHVAAVSGDLRAAFRRGAAICGAQCIAPVPPAHVVVVSAPSPVTDTLYQASKLVANAASVVKPGGTILLAAECSLGVGPLSAVNQGIYELGLRPRLPSGVRVALFSSLPETAVAETYCDYVADLQARLAGEESVTVIPNASSAWLVAQ